MARMTKEQKKREFQDNFTAMKNSAVGQQAYNTVFADQHDVSNLLASGGGEDLGSLEEELASLSAMNSIRASERKQAFTQEMIFDQDIQLGMRDAAYVHASSEIRRRKAISSHRYDKTRKRRMNTSQETLLSANDKIRSLKAKLHPAQGQPQMTVTQRVEAMKSVYDQIRIADRNCAEAMALNKDEENRLKDKAELTYHKSMIRMLEREMEALEQGSPEYVKLSRILNVIRTSYEKLRLPYLEEEARAQQDQDLHDLNHGNIIEEQQHGPQLLDKEAEDHVRANVSVFEKFKDTLNDAKYGNILDPLWDQMKTKASDLVNGWEEKTDFERGDALADVLIAANRLLSKEGPKNDTDKARETAAKQFRSFFKSVLESMSLNCRVLALERIFKKVDEVEDDPNTSEAVKKANDSIFTELAKERYLREHPNIDESDDSLKMIEDFHYRLTYAYEKQLMHVKNVDREFGNTKEFAIANLKYDFERGKSEGLLADDFRVDRFGNVLAEDVHKKEQWATLIKEIAEADNTEKALKIVRKLYARTENVPVDPEWFTEKGFKRNAYEARAFTRRILFLENYYSCFRAFNRGTLAQIVARWNQAHPNDPLSQDLIKDSGINLPQLAKEAQALQEIPAIQARCEMEVELDFNLLPGLLGSKGISWGTLLNIKHPMEMKACYKLKQFITSRGRQSYQYDPLNDLVPLVHQDGTDLNMQADVDNRNMLVYNAQNPLIFKNEKTQPGIIEKARKLKNTGYLNGSEKHGDVMKRVEARVSKTAKAEEDAMVKLRSLTEGKGDPAERTNLENLYKDYLNEMNVQAIAAETLFQADIDCDLQEGEERSGYYKEALKYYQQKDRINKLFDDLEKAREDFIKKNVSEEAYKTWKKELDDQRKLARDEIKQIENENTTALDRIKKAFVDQAAIGRTESFTDEEYELVKSHYPGLVWSGQEKERILAPFILHVNRDFSGAYLTEQDRYNADFNKRFKEAMKSGDAEAIKNLSREFTEKTLPLVNYVDPEGLENTDAEGIEQKYINSGNIYYRKIKLCMISNVNHASNTKFPLLKVGLDELKEKDPLKYAQITGKLTVLDNPVFDSLMLENGYNTESMIPSPEAQDAQALKASTEFLNQLAKDSVRQMEESIAEAEHAKREKELADTKNKITAKSAQRARKLDEEEDKRIEAIKRAERERIVEERIRLANERLERERRELEERARLQHEKEERERLEREKKEQEEREKQERERLEREKQERERLDREKKEKEEQEKRERDNKNEIIEEDEVEAKKDEKDDLADDESVIEIRDSWDNTYGKYKPLSEEKKKELLELGKKLDSDEARQDELDTIKEKHYAEYNDLDRDWKKRDKHNKAAKAFEEDLIDYLIPIRQLTFNTLLQYIDKRDRTEEDYEKLNDELDTLERYKSLILSDRCAKQGETYNLPIFALYDKYNIRNCLKEATSSIAIDDMLKQHEDLRYMDNAIDRLLRRIEEIPKEKGLKDGEGRTELDDRLVEEKEDLENRIKIRDKKYSLVDKTDKEFGKLSDEEQTRKIDEEVSKFKKMYDEKVFPEYRDYFDTIEKYIYYLGRKNEESSFYKDRIALFEKNITMLESLLRGEDENSMAVRERDRFKDNKTVTAIQKELSDLWAKQEEDQEYLTQIVAERTGIQQQMKDKLYDESELTFLKGKQSREKKGLVIKLMDAGEEYLHKISQSVTEEGKYEGLKALSDLTDEMMKEGLKLEDLTKKQYNDLKNKCPMAERKLYTDYISRHRYDLKKETIDPTEDPQMVQDTLDVKMKLDSDSEPTKIEVTDHKKVDESKFMPGFKGNAYRLKFRYELGESEGFMICNPENMKIFNNLKQGGFENNWRGYRGVCGPSSASHVINQLYGMNISNENINVHLVTRELRDSYKFLPMRDEKGKKINGKRRDRLNLRSSGGAGPETISALYNFYNIKHEVYKNKHSEDKDDHINEDGVDLDIIHMAEELDKGNLVHVTINTKMLYKDFTDPRDDPSFFENKKVKKHKTDWESGKVYTNHWICLCGAVYDENDWDRVDSKRTTTKRKKLTGFMIKDTGNGTMTFITRSQLQAAYRGHYRGGIKYKTPLILQDSAYIVCHKPAFDEALTEEIKKHSDLKLDEYKKQKEEERRLKAEAEEKRRKEEEERRRIAEEKRKKEQEEKQKRIDSFMGGLRTAFGQLTDIATITAFYDKCQKEFDPNNEEWIDEIDNERRIYLNQREAYNKAFNGSKKEFEDLKKALKNDPEYKEITEKFTAWQSAFGKREIELFKRFVNEYAPAAQFLKDINAGEFLKDINKESTDKYLKEFLDATRKYREKGGVYDCEGWIVGFFEKYEKLYKDYIDMVIELEKRFKKGIRRRAVCENEVYQEIKNFVRFGMYGQFFESVKEVNKIKIGLSFALEKPILDAFDKHKHDVTKIQEKHNARWRAAGKANSGNAGSGKEVKK